MDFYTNVCRSRDKILVQGYAGGKETKDCSFLLIWNISLLPQRKVKHLQISRRQILEVVELNSMGGARKFREKYEGVEGFSRYMVMTDMSTHISQISFKVTFSWDFNKGQNSYT